MSFAREDWIRLEYRGTPVYLDPRRPVWFVPNHEGDKTLKHLQEHPAADPSAAEMRFLARLPDGGEVPTYPGRSAFLQTQTLHELWFHVTNRCDLACRHCLFSCAPKEADELPAARLLQLATQAYDLGTRVFALTGGEPFVHREFPRVLEGLLSWPDTNLVILTNGMSLRSREDLLSRLPRERVHLQVSVDGLQRSHDRLRGKNAFEKLRKELEWLAARDWPFTISTCIDRGNMHEMSDLADLASEVGATGLHFMWYFVRGRGKKAGAPDMEALASQLIGAVEHAADLGLTIDNVDAVKGRIFAPPGTKHDGSSSGWESVAVGPDGRLFPSPALIGIEELATPIGSSLAEAWRGSPALARLRASTIAASDSPMRFLLGGGDSDHSYVHAGTFSGDDPYLPVYETLALWLIDHHARSQPVEGPPRLRLKMGDLLETCSVSGEVALTHSNCVLALSGEDGVAAVGRFYSEAAAETKTDILNPVCYAEDAVSHIPTEGRVRSYGCGSPVLDARLAPGETVVDLGSGTGVECFIAARLVGTLGRVIGIDMLDPMLELAGKTAVGVRRNLGYDNLAFRKGLLEDLPLEESSADLVLSNCVLNLSHDKRRSFAEIFRVLRPGGRLVVSDVVCEEDPGPAIRNDDVLKGECLGGALTQRDLFGLLDEAGFTGARVLKRFPYRQVRGHAFFSMTFEARKSAPSEKIRAMYRGPFAALLASDGTLLPAGETVSLERGEAARLSEQVFLFDDQGAVSNVLQGVSACCSPDAAASPEGSSCCEIPPEEDAGPRALPTLPSLPSQRPPSSSRLEAERSGCMLCGTELEYRSEEQIASCVYCGESFSSAMCCPEGHFVCDGCHAAGSRDLLQKVCLASHETDMVELMHRIRSHPSFSVHGPEHHGMVPGVILAACRNAGATISDEQILRGIRRGAKIPGGACGYMGVCGASAGLGSAFGVLLESTPRKASERQTVLRAVARVTEEIASYAAARCCQRDCYVALKVAADLAPSIAKVSPVAEIDLRCNQIDLNPDCIGESCPLHPAH